MKNIKKIAIAMLGVSLWGADAYGEVNTIALAHQNGIGYLPLYVMKELQLVEKYAKEEKIELTAEYKNLGSPGVIRDALLTNQVQFGVIGVPTLIQLADKTINDKKGGTFKAAANIVSLPMYLNTTEDVKTPCEIKGKIALPTIKTAIQAVTLQMYADKMCGGPFVLDDKTVSMTHPDGMQALLTGQVGSHFTAPPFQYIELKQGKDKVKRLIKSYDIMGGSASFVLLVGNEKFAVDNPKVYKVVMLALEESMRLINENKKKAAEIYIAAEKPKETVEDITAQLNDPDFNYTVTPERIGVFSEFMYKIGSIKNKMDWKAMTMPNLHDKSGS